MAAFLLVCATGTETVNESASAETRKLWLHRACDIVVNQEFYDHFVIPFPEKTVISHPVECFDWLLLTFGDFS